MYVVTIAYYMVEILSENYLIYFTEKLIYGNAKVVNNCYR